VKHRLADCFPVAGVTDYHFAAFDDCSVCHRRLSILEFIDHRIGQFHVSRLLEFAASQNVDALKPLMREVSVRRTLLAARIATLSNLVFSY
jgi:hypothetical protein